MDNLPWLQWMIDHIGEAEVTGQPPTDFDRMVFSHTNYGDLGHTMEASCAATMCAALELTGYKSPHSARALDFSDYGMQSELVPGAVCVFDFGGGDHHVSILEALGGAITACPDGYGVFCGGNQYHALKRCTFKLSSIIHTRWPVK